MGGPQRQAPTRPSSKVVPSHARQIPPRMGTAQTAKLVKIPRVGGIWFAGVA